MVLHMDITKHIERAQEAVRKKNFDYAVALYHQVLAIKPDHGEARAELRQALFRKSEYVRTSPLIRRLQTLPQLLAFFVAKLSKNQDSLIRACERFLQIDPRNVFVNFTLGRALEKAGYLNSASAVFEFIAEIDDRNVEALKCAGAMRYKNRDISGAIALFERALKISPRDAEAEKMRKNLAAEGTLASSSYEKAKSSHELIKEKDEAAHLQRRTRLHKTGEELDAEVEHLKARIAENPDDRRPQRELGELYVRKKDFGNARAHYRKMLDDDPQSFDIRCALGDLDILAYGEEIAKLESRLIEEGDAGGNVRLKEDLEALKNERLAKEIEEYRWRVDEHPTDLGLWHQYGTFVFRAGKTDEAIEAFQHAVKDPQHKRTALHMLGKAFYNKELYDLARKQLKTALDESGGVNDKTKPITYDLGKTAEAAGDREGAMDWYLKIFEIDINFRDVAQKSKS